MLPSLEVNEGLGKKLRVLVLEIRDRNKTDRGVIAHLLVEREERYDRYADGQLRQARIELSYRMIGVAVAPASGQGEFRGCYSATDNRVSVTACGVWERGFVTLDLPGLEGQRVGTYLMNEIVRWARQWPDADVNNIQLLEGQAYKRNTVRRNRFYEQFGFTFDYMDAQHRAGMSHPVKVRDLKAVESWKDNIAERRMFDFLMEQADSRRAAQVEAGDYPVHCRI
ncbi:hypothetical protein [Paraburkholderia hospita]|uniref:hypothetical protein n=1 Tax=Paraburkholderia hospita TaxID=169430 RepID=UPI0012602605|nr:hypothetical protein [Paraburkholderia hospita]